MNTSLASRSANVDHLVERMRSALLGADAQMVERCAREFASAIADLDHKLRVEVDEALGRLEARIESELRDFAEQEQ